MIIAKCPLRISLAGGSTDLQDFIDQHGVGAVISFPSTLYTYISLHENHRGKYIIDYTAREEVSTPQDIKNNIAREVLKEYDLPPVTITFNTDAHSSGTGLASSSSYLIALIKAAAIFLDLSMSNFEICKKALELERKFNPLTGYQDPYGCGLGAFKKIVFSKNEDPVIKYLDQSIFRKLEMHLIYTQATASSSCILKKIASSNRRELLRLVDGLERSVEENDLDTFTKLIKLGWDKKKEIMPYVVESNNIKQIDTALQAQDAVLVHRLCGAGNRGYFLSLSKVGEFPTFAANESIKINICQHGVIGKKI